MVKKKTDTQTESWDQMIQALCQRNRSTPETQCVCYTELKREAGLLQAAEQGGGYYIQTSEEAGFIPYCWIQEAALVDLGWPSWVGAVSVGSSILAVNIPGVAGKRLCWTFSAHSVNVHTWTRERLCHACFSVSHWGSSWQQYMSSGLHSPEAFSDPHRVANIFQFVHISA